LPVVTSWLRGLLETSVVGRSLMDPVSHGRARAWSGLARARRAA
jgi:hypothetical protein